MSLIETAGLLIIVFWAAIGAVCNIYAFWFTTTTVKRQVLRGHVEEMADVRDSYRMREQAEVKELEEDRLRRMYGRNRDE